MVYRYPGYKKRSIRVSKRRPKSRKTSWGGMAFNALSGYALRSLKKKLGLNTESKIAGTNGTTTATTTLVARIAMPTIIAGTSNVGQRVGSSIRITAVKTRIAAIMPSTATTSNLVRIIQVRDRQNGNPTVADILETPTEFCSPLNNNFVAAGLQLLKDVVLPCTLRDPLFLEWTHSALNDQCVYPDGDTAGAPSSLIEGSIVTHWMVADGTSIPIFSSRSEFYYVDN